MVSEPKSHQTATPRCKICQTTTDVLFERPKDDGVVIEAKLHGPDYVRPYYRCPSCGLVFHTAFDNLDGGQYTMGPAGKPDPQNVKLEPLINRAIREVAIARELFLLHGINPPGTRLLVYGCGKGLSLNLFLQNKIDAYGSDLFDEIRTDLPFPEPLYDKSLNQEMHRRFIKPDRLRHGWFDVITLIEVFEHFINPLKEMKVLIDLLKPGGILYGSTGMADRVQGDLNEWQYLKCMTHTLFPTRKAFQFIAAKLGVLADVYPPTPQITGQASTSWEQAIFVLHKP